MLAKTKQVSGRKLVRIRMDHCLIIDKRLAYGQKRESLIDILLDQALRQRGWMTKEDSPVLQGGGEIPA